MKTFVVRFVVVVVVLSAALAASGDVPRILTIQGKLTDSLGQPVPDGVQSVTFRLYDVETGGTALWQEVQNVQTNGGLLNVNLGAVTPITLAFDKQYWLGIQPTSCSEFAPRTRLTTVPYAVRAEVADTVPDGSITAAKLAPGVAIPPGTILMWSGTTSTIPQGWVLCDGSNQTPDLRDRFVVGAGSGYAAGATGGAATVPHSHAVSGTTPGGTQSAMAAAGAAVRLASDTHYHSFSATSDGASDAENRPPYYALCFIMKLGY